MNDSTHTQVETDTVELELSGSPIIRIAHYPDRPLSGSPIIRIAH